MLVVVFWVGLGLTGLRAQEALLAAGGNALGRSGGSVSYSVGQLFYTTNISVNVTVTQGVQQPCKISILPQSEDSSLINIVCSVYPNPVTNNVTLNIENYKDTGLFYQLYNSNGQQIEGESISASQVSISMAWLVAELYFLKIMIRGQEIKTFKIIKR